MFEPLFIKSYSPIVCIHVSFIQVNAWAILQNVKYFIYTYCIAAVFAVIK